MADYMHELSKSGAFQDRRQRRLLQAMDRRSGWLTGQFMKNAIDPRRCAHIAVDVQRPYVIFRAEDTARRIAQLAPVFRQHAIRNYWIWLGGRHEKPNFSIVKPSKWKGDDIIRKAEISSFNGTSLEEKLKKRKIDTLFVSGFMAACCVRATLFDASQKGYRTVLMTDCTDFGSMIDSSIKDLQILFDQGVIFTTADDVRNGLIRNFGF